MGGLFGAGLRGEHALDDGRRAAQAAKLQVLDAGVLGVPGDDLGAGGAQGVVDAAAAHHIGAFQHRDHAGQARLQQLRAAFGTALELHHAAVVVEFDDRRHIGELQHVEALGDAGADLGGVAVDGLLAGEDDVGRAEGLADLADRLGERIGRGQRVGAREEAVGEQDGAVGADRQRLAQRIGRHRRAHGQHGHFAADLVAKAQGLFQREQVIRIDDRRHALPHDRIGHRMDADLRRVRNLLDADDKMHIRLRRFHPQSLTEERWISAGASQAPYQPM